MDIPYPTVGSTGLRMPSSPVFSCYPGTYDAYSTVDSSRCCSLRCRATSRSTVRWQLPVSLAFLPSTLGPACTYASLTMKYFWYATCHLCVLRIRGFKLGAFRCCRQPWFHCWRGLSMELCGVMTARICALPGLRMVCPVSCLGRTVPSVPSWLDENKAPLGVT